jgi:hypothetical protein
MDIKGLRRCSGVDASMYDAISYNMPSPFISLARTRITAPKDASRPSWTAVNSPTQISARAMPKSLLRHEQLTRRVGFSDIRFDEYVGDNLY